MVHRHDPTNHFSPSTPETVILFKRQVDHVQPLALHTTQHGALGSPLVILHGLLGSSRNWHTMAQSLSREYAVLSVDLRNHGRSPHSAEMDYTHLVADVSDLLRKRRLRDVHLLGHSLGGKVAMALALAYPDRLKTLTVVDIAPATYSDGFSTILQGMKRVALDSATSRSAIDEDLSRSVTEARMRQFLLTNLAAGPDGYRWQVNLDPLQKALPDLLSFPEMPHSARFAKPALFVAGARSDYIRPRHHAKIRQLFPEARFDVIENAGHWPHFDNPQRFTESLLAFLRIST